MMYVIFNAYSAGSLHMPTACELCSRPVSDADKKEAVEILMAEHGLIERKAAALRICPACARSETAPVLISWYEEDHAETLLVWAMVRRRDARLRFSASGTWSVVLDDGRSATFAIAAPRDVVWAALDRLIRPTG
jgi:hypothetical protein